MFTRNNSLFLFAHLHMLPCGMLTIDHERVVDRSLGEASIACGVRINISSISGIVAGWGVDDVVSNLKSNAEYTSDEWSNEPTSAHAREIALFATSLFSLWSDTTVWSNSNTIVWSTYK